jgi:DNA-binding transcriptional MocR family regulator
MSAIAISGNTSESIYRSVRDLIQKGRLRPGEALPPLRELAETLAVNRNTVGAAYRRLASDGYVHADGRRGTIVGDNRTPTHGVPTSPPGLRNLSDGNPDPALLPDLGPALAQAARRKYLYGEFIELPELIETAPAFFSRPDMQPGQTAIVSGAMDGLERILVSCLKPGDRVIVEDPCFGTALDLVRALGLAPIPVEVDRYGIVPSSLERALRRDAQAIIITPVAQNPTGATMTADRLDRVIHILSKYENVLVIEDDHFGPLCIDSLPSNYGAHGKNWVTICSVSKFLGPDMRFAMLFGNPHVIKLVKVRQRLAARWVSHLLQGIALHFMLDPEMKKNLAHAGTVYTERRSLMKSRLEKLGFSPIEGIGLNIWVPMPDPKGLAQMLSAQGWMVRPGDAFTMEAGSGLRISTGRLDSETAEEFANALYGCITNLERSLTA